MTKPKIALIDGYGFVFRAYHSLPPLTRSDGTPLGAVYGFTNMLIKLLASLNVSHIACVFDAGSKTFRNDIYPEYKANRPECPEDLKPQFPLVRQAAEALNLAILEKVGFEADDIIATLTKQASREDFEVVIISSDKDLMQLIDQNVTMYDAMRSRTISFDEVFAKFFVNPDKVLDVLSLIGDASDNVPGVPSIGPKTAALLINEFGNLENLLDNLDQIKQQKRRQALQDNINQAKLSKTLITLDENVQLNTQLKDLEVKNIDPLKLIEFLDEQGFRSLSGRIKKDFNVGNQDLKLNNQPQKQNSNNQEQQFKTLKQIEIKNQEQIVKIKQQALNSGKLTIYFSKNNQYLTAYPQSQEIFFLKINSDQEQANNLFNQEDKEENNLNLLKSLIKISQIQSIKTISYNYKNNSKFLNQLNLNNQINFDEISLMSYVLDSGSTSPKLRNLIDLNLDLDIESNQFAQNLELEEKSKIDFENNQQAQEFYCQICFCITELYQIFTQRITQEKQNFIYYSVEKPLLEILNKMENNGIKVDQIKLNELSSQFAGKINKLEQEIHTLASHQFNIASTKQLGEVLFEKLGIKSLKKSKKSGQYSTDSKILEELAIQGYVIAEKILDFRHLSKLKSTYCDALPKYCDQNNRIHSNFSSTSTVTGRLSSSEPNLQNIPVRTPSGNEIRKSFIAKSGYKLISADYSQIELRVLAHIADIKPLKEAFKENKDIHKITAANIFNINEDEVDSTIRRKAKAINFGIIYGISAFGLARQLKIDRKTAQDAIDRYFEKYSGIKDYMNQSQEFAEKYGYVQTISGKKCFIKDINSKNPTLKSFSQRLAINAPIQGSAADIIKKAMIDLNDKLDQFDAKLVLQIHDELIIEAKEDQAQKVAQLIKSTMENAFHLDVPLKVDANIGNNWFEIH